MLQPIDLILLDLGNTLIYDREPWPSLFAAADAELWRVLHGAGVDLVPSDVYGQFETLFSLYNFRHRGTLDEPTTGSVLTELLRQKGAVPGELAIHAGLRAMYAVTQSNWYPEVDAIPMLQRLRERQFRVGVVSNAADDENTQTLIDKFGFRQYLDYVVSSAAYGKRKPHPEIFRAALDHFETPPERTVMVGDTYDADIAGGLQVGLRTIWITRRLREVPNPKGPAADAIVSALGEIPEIVSR